MNSLSACSYSVIITFITAKADKANLSVYMVVISISAAAVLAVAIVIVIRLNRTRRCTLCEYTLCSAFCDSDVLLVKRLRISNYIMT